MSFRALILLASSLSLFSCTRKRDSFQPPEITEDERAFSTAERRAARSGEHPVPSILIDTHSEGIALCESCHDRTSPLGLAASAKLSCARCHEGRGVRAYVPCEQDADCDIPGSAITLRCVAERTFGATSILGASPLPGRCGVSGVPKRIELAPSQRSGLDLIAAIGCVNCHAAETSPVISPARSGESVANMAPRITSGGVAEALAQASGLHSKLEWSLSTEQLRFLSAVEHPKPPDLPVTRTGKNSVAHPEVALSRGKALLTALECDACHGDQTPEIWRVDLSRLPHVRSRQATAQFLSLPPPEGHRPYYALTSAELADLTELLFPHLPITAQNRPQNALEHSEQAGADGGFSSHIAPTWRDVGCTNCHAGSEPNKTKARPLREIAHLVSTSKFDVSRRLVRHEGKRQVDMPRLKLSDGESDDIVLALLAWDRRAKRPAPPQGKRERAAQLASSFAREALYSRALDLRCQSCHPYEDGDPSWASSGIAPSGGSTMQRFSRTLRAPAIVSLLTSEAPFQPKRSRPRRMASFALSTADARVIAAGISTIAPGLSVPLAPTGDAEIALGAKLYERLRCDACHGEASAVAASDLRNLPERLSPMAIEQILIDPQGMLGASSWMPPLTEKMLRLQLHSAAPGGTQKGVPFAVPNAAAGKTDPQIAADAGALESDLGIVSLEQATAALRSYLLSTNFAQTRSVPPQPR